MHVGTRVCVPLTLVASVLVRIFFIARDRNLICSNTVWKGIDSHPRELNVLAYPGPCNVTQLSPAPFLILLSFVDQPPLLLQMACLMGGKGGFLQPRNLIFPAYQPP